MRLHVVAGVLAAAVTTGCGSVARTAEDAGGGARGKQLFVERCGSCHVLADAGTQGTVAPNLDEAFDDVIEQGFDESTIADVVRGQIAYPVEDPPTEGAVGMPANLVTGEDADAVAAYVASVAGKPVQGGAQRPAVAEADGEQIFTSAGCGSCHVLAAAQSTGTVGPNLDESKASLEEAIAQIREGGGGMPAFKDQLTGPQIRAVAAFVSESAGK